MTPHIFSSAAPLANANKTDRGLGGSGLSPTQLGQALGAASLALMLTLLGGPAGAQPQPQDKRQEARAPSSARAGKAELLTLNFHNADLEAVARTLAHLTGFNVVVDPRVKGTITLVSEQPVSRSAAMNQFLDALRLQGFTMVGSAGLYKVVPEAEAKLQSSVVNVGDQQSDSHQVSTQIFRLDFESAQNLVPLLRPLISPNNLINANPSNNTLVITDYADNLRRIARIIAALDAPHTADAEILPLQHAIAADLAPLILKLIDTPAQTDPAFKTVLLAEPRSNSLILRAAHPMRVALVKSLVRKLDQVALGDHPSGNIHVVYLKNANATQLAATLQGVLRGESAAPGSNAASPSAANPSGTTGPSNNAARDNSAAGGGQILADATTNSLIITAPEPQYRQLRAVIDQLDMRRAQVFVESLIAEVNAERAAEFGVQWQGVLGGVNGPNIGLLGTNFGNGVGNILNLSQSIANGTPALPTGLNAGIAHRVNGVYMLGALANFIQSSGSGNVLSTPNLLTLDNEEAKIVIGQNVPFVTGQFTNTGGNASTVNPFQTIERKDVGLTLRVKPQVSANDTVRLSIFQEVSSVQASTLNNASGPTTNKRTIETNVLVQDGAVVVLGGLLQDEYASSEEKVPGLGDIPILGYLFRSEKRSRSKTNLMVFLRPVVLRDASANEQLALSRYDLMRASFQEAQPQPSRTTPVNEAAQLPVLPAPSPGANLGSAVDAANNAARPAAAKADSKANSKTD